MKTPILVYITCRDVKEAQKIGQKLLERKLCGCVNILPDLYSLFFFPPKSRKLQKQKEVLLLVKSFKKLYNSIEKEVKQNHSYEIPCIIALNIEKMEKSFETWLANEISQT